MNASARLPSLLAATALASLVPTGGAHADETLDDARARWGAANVESYEYRYQKVCECHRDMPSDTIVTVREGSIVGVRYTREDYREEIAVPADRHGWFRTIDDLFSLVSGALERGATVRVSYDPRLGYPTRIYVDYRQDLIGEEVELHVLALSETD